MHNRVRLRKTFCLTISPINCTPYDNPFTKHIGSMMVSSGIARLKVERLAENEQAINSCRCSHRAKKGLAWFVIG